MFLVETLADVLRMAMLMSGMPAMIAGKNVGFKFSAVNRKVLVVSVVPIKENATPIGVVKT